MTQCTVRLNAAAGEMAREEIGKQAAFLSKSIGKVSFSEDGSTIHFEAGDDEAADLQTALERTATRIVRSLRSLERKVVFASTASPCLPGECLDGRRSLPGNRASGAFGSTAKAVPIISIGYSKLVAIPGKLSLCVRLL